MLEKMVKTFFTIIVANGTNIQIKVGAYQRDA